MNFDQANYLVSQWAAWSMKGDTTIRKLDASRAKWQDEYRAPFDPQNEDDPRGTEVDDEIAYRIDRVMAALRADSGQAYRTWWNHAARGEYCSDELLAYALGKFNKYFEEVLAESDKVMLNSWRGQSRA